MQFVPQYQDLGSAINEINSKIREARSEYVTKARLELNEAITEYQRVGAESSHWQIK